jgi:hypothetical protein
MADRAQARRAGNRLHISNIASLRGSMADLLESRIQWRTRRDPPITSAQRFHEVKTQQRAEEGLALLKSIEREEQKECEHWVQQAAARAEILGWKDMRAEESAMLSEQPHYADLATEHLQTAEARRPRLTSPPLVRVFENDLGEVTVLRADVEERRRSRPLRIRRLGSAR